MSQLSKQALKVENNTSFPNNTTNYITPAILRDFNVDMIDSLVDENTFNDFSQSVTASIEALQNFSSSLDTNFASQAEFNSYTQSNDSKVNALINATASYADSASVAAVDAVQQAQINSLIAATGSYVTSSTTVNTGSLLLTASFDNATRNLTFTKGDASTFAVNIPDVSGSTGNFATTGSNTFNGSQTVSGYVSASAGFKAGANTTALEIGDGSNIRFITGSSFYNIQLVPGVGDIAFSRDGAGNVKVFTLAGAAGNTTTFQNNAVQFQSTVGGVTFGAPIAVNSGVNSNVDITGSLKISSTFDAPLTEGYVWVGANNGRTTTVATSSFATSLTSLNSFTASQAVSNSYFATTGSNTFVGVEAINYVSGSGTGEVYLLANSGSLVLGNSTATPTYAALAFLSSSVPNANTNLIFKTNTNTTSLTVSGSANLFVPPSAPTAEFKRYLGGSGNVALLASVMPQITGSNAISPTFNNNTFQGNGFFMRTPASSSAWTISANSFNNFGNINLGTAAGTPFVSASAGVTISNNFIGGTLASTAYKTTLYGPFGLIQSYVGGTLTMNNDSSSITFVNSAMQGALTVNNSYNAGTTTNANSLALSAGNVFMGTNNLINASGSNTTTSVSRQIQSSALIGSAHTASVVLNGDNSHLSSTALIGHSLVVTGSSAATTTSVTGSDRGTVIVGRFNADVQSGNTVFAVGAGTSVSNRRNALLIDSGSNTTISGSVNMSGSLTIQSGSGDLYMYGHKMFNMGAFQDTTTQSGSADTAYAFKFNTTDVPDGVAISGSTGLQVANAGNYNIQWSGQLSQGASSGDVTVWLRKNGTDISGTGGRISAASNTKLIPAWNYVVTLAANDVVEIMWGSTSANTTWEYIPAATIYPACASIIATVTQVK